MRKKLLPLALLWLPCSAVAADSEIEQLKSELEALKALYSSKINEVETRLANIEKEEKFNQKRVSEEVLAGGEAHPERFRYYGYMRAGFGVNDDGTSQERFQLPGSDAAYRLGNEVDTYVETGFSYYHLNEGMVASDPIFGTHVMLAYSTVEKATNISVGSNEGDVAIREAYVSGKNLIGKKGGETVWGGQRYYRRQSVHMNDFFWLDMSGFGGGIEDYDLGFAKLSASWIGGTKDNYTGNGEFIGRLKNTDKNNFDFRFNDIDLGIGKGNIWLNYSSFELRGDIIERDADGFSTGFWLISPFGNGSKNTAIVQYGEGVAANFNSFSPSLRSTLDGGIPLGTDLDDQSRLRLMNVTDFNFGDKLDMQMLLLYQEEDLGLESDSDITWYSIGARPVYSFNSLYNLVFEVGYDHSELETGESGHLIKFTIAPEITPDFGFWSRPAIRTFLTYAKWSDDFEGMVGGDAYATDTSGFTVGVQVESWW